VPHRPAGINGWFTVLAASEIPMNTAFKRCTDHGEEGVAGFVQGYSIVRAIRYTKRQT
jgi:hypothetical protein